MSGKRNRREASRGGVTLTKIKPSFFVDTTPADSGILTFARLKREERYVALSRMPLSNSP